MRPPTFHPMVSPYFSKLFNLLIFVSPVLSNDVTVSSWSQQTCVCDW